MKWYWFLSLSAITMLSAQQTPRVSDLAWLTGAWEMSSGERRTEEVWLAPAGNTMFSVSRTYRGETTLWYEYVRIDQDSSGTIRFHAAPSGQAGGSFPMKEMHDGYVLFENPGHDFPQRIIYRRISPDSLLGRIEGTVKGKTRAMDFPYRKMKN